MNIKKGTKTQRIFWLIAIVFTMFFVPFILAPTIDNVAQIYSSSTLGQDGNDALIAITFDSRTLIQSSFGHSTSSNTNRLFVNKTSLYKLSYSCTWQTSTANGRHIMENFLRVNGVDNITPSLSSCYIRTTSSDGNRCDNSGVLLANLTNGDYIELMGSALQGTSGDTVSRSDCYLYAQEVQEPVAQIYDNVGNDNYEGTTINVSLDTQTYVDTNYFSSGSDSLTFLRDGIYRVSYHVCSESNGQNNRQTPQSYLTLNGAQYHPSTTFSYIRQSGDADRNCGEATLLMNITANDFITINHNKFAQEGGGSSITLVNQSWLFAEFVNTTEVGQFNLLGGQTNISSNTAVIFDDDSLTSSFITRSGSRISFLKEGLYEISYRLGWEDDEGNDRIVVCGSLRKNGGTTIVPSQSCDYSRGDPQAKRQGVSNSVIVNVSQNEYIELMGSPSGSDAKPLGNATWLSVVKIRENPRITWDQNTLTVPDVTIAEGNLSIKINVSAYEANTNVEYTCILGDCSTIVINQTSHPLILDQDNRELEFTCSDSTLGSYNAIYSVNSSEDRTNDNINVSCRVFPVFGKLNVSLEVPAPNSVSKVGQNRTFTIRGSITCSGEANTTCGNVSAYARYNVSLGNFGDESDGSLTVTSPNTIINNYTYLNTFVNAGSSSFTVNDATDFEIGDEILIIQMQNGSGFGSAGTYEFATISNKVLNTLTLENSLNNTYGSGVFNSTSSSATQIVRVPQYVDLTVNSGASIVAKKWDGFSGGIVIFRATNNFNSTGYINVSSQGFRGGDCNGCGNSADGDQGEGTTGLGINSQTPNGIGGGGGFGPTGLGGEPGAGGGHATSGQDGTSATTSNGGLTVGFANLSSIYFGGGGGAGGDDDNVNPPAQFRDGGGIAIIFAENILNARIHSLGENAAGGGGAGGVAGAGAGGSIWIQGGDVTLVDVNASGGRSFNDGDDTGGSGGDGRVRVDSETSSGTTSPISGFNSTTSRGEGFIQISTTTSQTPFVSLTPQPQNCGTLNQGDSCTLTWTINATGEINSSHLVDILFFSNISKIQSNDTLNAQINITKEVAPSITLLNPINNSKIVGDLGINFTWSITDEFVNLTCYFYLNEMLNQTLPCTTGNNSLKINDIHGITTWRVGARDFDNLTSNSTLFTFVSILDYDSLYRKEITSINTNQYFVNNYISNRLNFTRDLTLIDHVDISFLAGSFSPNFNFTNSTNGTTYFGRIYGWDVLNTSRINYSISGIDGYYLEKNYILGSE